MCLSYQIMLGIWLDIRKIIFLYRVLYASVFYSSMYHIFKFDWDGLGISLMSFCWCRSFSANGMVFCFLIWSSICLILKILMYCGRKVFRFVFCFHEAETELVWLVTDRRGTTLVKFIYSNINIRSWLHKTSVHCLIENQKYNDIFFILNYCWAHFSCKERHTFLTDTPILSQILWKYNLQILPILTEKCNVSNNVQ